MFEKKMGKFEHVYKKTCAVVFVCDDNMGCSYTDDDNDDMGWTTAIISLP